MLNLRKLFYMYFYNLFISSVTFFVVFWAMGTIGTQTYVNFISCQEI